MGEVKLVTDRIEVRLHTGVDMVNISAELAACIRRSGIGEGTLNATVVGSTGSITTIEHEPGVIEDLARAIDRMAPAGMDYAHEEAWHDGNGHSHVQAAILGPSVALPIRQGRLKLGTWQQVVVINHDNRPRTRSLEVTLVGRAG